MKPIKKFSTELNQPKSILESIDSKALTELINGMGFKDIHELKKEKNLLSKLEALLKEVGPIAEDDAAEIEDKLNKKAEPKSLEDKANEKKPDVPVGSTDEVSEEEAEEEAEEDVEEEEAEEKDVEEEEAEEESAEEESTKPSRRIMKFEDFVQTYNSTYDVTESEQSEVYEAKVESDDDFKEYAFTVLQNAFGEEFDETTAQELVDGLISKYDGDYGAMIGALQSSLG